MKELKINEEYYNGVTFNIEFTDKINMIRGDSGTGKTFMFEKIKEYCTDNNIKYASINYDTIQLLNEEIYALCKRSEIILFDNADLFDKELIEEILKLDKFIIISIKKIAGMRIPDYVLYDIDYNNKELCTIRRG